MTQIEIVQTEGNQDVKARVAAVAEAYVAAVEKGDIKVEIPPEKIVFDIRNHSEASVSGNAVTNGIAGGLMVIKIDVDFSTKIDPSRTFESTALHEIVHAFNPSLHQQSGDNNSNTRHAADFYEKVDSDAAVLGIDPKTSGTGHSFYDPEARNPNPPDLKDFGIDDKDDAPASGSVGSSMQPLRPDVTDDTPGEKMAPLRPNSVSSTESKSDGGKGATVEPDPQPAPKAKKVKKEKKKDSGKPVVVDLDGDGVETTDLGESEAMFDFDNDGFREKTAWVGADDGLLVFDVGGDGQVTEAKEIAFAYWTEDENDTDLEGLRTVFDSNNDGQLNEKDEDWAGFRIWQDKNQNGVSEEGEFLTLEEAGIQSIGLEHKEGTGEIHEDGTVNHGMLDVQMTDGSVNEGGDIAFANEADGQREIIDTEGITVIEYESDTFVFEEPDEGFTVTDYDNFVTRIHNMGIAETAVSALQYASQIGTDVVFDFGDERLTLEDVSLDQLSVDLQSFANDLLVA